MTCPPGLSAGKSTQSLVELLPPSSFTDLECSFFDFPLCPEDLELLGNPPGLQWQTDEAAEATNLVH